jgi:DeoR/GlpR family transcriptional regulator of sugar metabolism
MTSIRQRRTREDLAPSRLATAAFALLRPGETAFLDASPTTLLLARLIARSGSGVRVLTNSLSVLNQLSGDSTEVVAIGGAYRRGSRSYAGPAAVRAVREHFADRCFFGVAGVSPNGVMTEADALEAEVKRAMLEQSESAVLLLDRPLAGAVGHHAVGRISVPELVLADALTLGALARLQALGATVCTTSAPTV